jgi:predicted ATPase
MGYESMAYHVYQALSSWVVYHFHDTGETAAVRRKWTTRDHEELRPDASNLAPVLLRIQEQWAEQYQIIRDTVRLVAPFFDDFKLRPEPNGADTVVQLEWTQRGSDYPFHPSQLSDGTLRFICMTTALLQQKRPATILFDEPELGLHPYALSVLAGLFKQAVARTQLVVSTQSAALVDEFEPEDVIVVGRKDGASTFRRLDRAQLGEWLEEYSLGELWRKNVIEGGPVYE